MPEHLRVWLLLQGRFHQWQGRGLWEGFYCPAGTTAKKPIGGNRGKPVGGNPARFCDKEACPSGSACLNGVAAPLMTWHSPAACKSESADAPYIVEIDESTAYPNFGKLFKVNAHTSMDTSAYKVNLAW